MAVLDYIFLPLCFDVVMSSVVHCEPTHLHLPPCSQHSTGQVGAADAELNAQLRAAVVVFGASADQTHWLCPLVAFGDKS